MNGPYDDIIRLPHHVSSTRPQMPRANRAAQFLPFSALSGFDAYVDETARLTETRLELSEDAIAILEAKLNILAKDVEEHPEVTIIHFQPDQRKAGGAYVAIPGRIKRIDAYEHAIVLLDGAKIPISDILEIESPLFRHMEANSE